MSTFRENLISRMISLYNMEHKAVKDFCYLCERFPNTEQYDKHLEIIVITHEKHPQY